MTHLPDKIERLPILILYPHSRCNCRCLMCDIWKRTDDRTLTAADFERHLGDIQELRVEQVVFSGGEPLMSPDLFRLAARLLSLGVRTTLLTTGLLLERFAAEVAAGIDEVIVSLDGPPEIHNKIRRIPDAYARLAEGVRALDGRLPIHGRCTVQRANHRHLRAAAESARALGLDSISFLAADLDSEAFNRPEQWTPDRQAEVALTDVQTEALADEIKALPSDPLVRESPEKLRRIVEHFRAHLGLAVRTAPPCNAPWVSAVVETSGTVRPCFFHEPVGDASGGLAAALNSPRAQRFRRELNVQENPVCRRCVCSLNLP